jgi:hypothetical protein
MKHQPPNGSARLKDNILTVTVQRKRGKKTVPLVVTYKVEDANPDPRCAYPVYSLTKDNGEVYHASVDTWGVRCDCVDGELREKRGSGICKHAAALMAVGKIPKETR